MLSKDARGSGWKRNGEGKGGRGSRKESLPLTSAPCPSSGDQAPSSVSLCPTLGLLCQGTAHYRVATFPSP